MKKLILGIIIGALGAGLIFGAITLIQKQQAPQTGVNGYMMQEQVYLNEAAPPYYGHGPGMMQNYRDNSGYGYGMMNNYGHMMGHGPGMMYGNYGMMGFGVGPYHEDLAAFLGMTEEELFHARLEGKSLLEIATEADITEEVLVEEISTLHSAHLDELVNKNIITKEQKEWMTDRCMVEYMVKQKAYVPNEQ